MGVNRGKEFEERVREALERVLWTKTIRLHDQTTGYKGSSNECDFLFFRSPVLHMIECKSCYGNTLPFSNITEKQLNLANNDVCWGVKTWFCVWFIDHDVTVLIPAWIIQAHNAEGRKSFNIKELETFNGICKIVPATKKRVFFDYDFSEVLT